MAGLRFGVGAGALDRRIKITRAVGALDEVGKPLADGQRAPVLEARASFQPVSDRERLAHMEIAEISARFKIRWSRTAAQIKRTDTLECEGVTYGIHGIKELGRRQYLEITVGAHGH